MNDHDRVETELAPLAADRWERGQHFERLKQDLRRASIQTRPRKRLLVGAALVVGIASGFGAAHVVPGWQVTLVGEGAPHEAILMPLDDHGAAPLGLLRSETGELYRVELIDGRLVMRELPAEEVRDD